MLCKKDARKNIANSTAACGISVNRPCLAGCKFIDVLQNSL